MLLARGSGARLAAPARADGDRVVRAPPGGTRDRSADGEDEERRHERDRRFSRAGEGGPACVDGSSEPSLGSPVGLETLSRTPGSPLSGAIAGTTPSHPREHGHKGRRRQAPSPCPSAGAAERRRSRRASSAGAGRRARAAALRRRRRRRRPAGPHTGPRAGAAPRVAGLDSLGVQPQRRSRRRRGVAGWSSCQIVRRGGSPRAGRERRGGGPPRTPSPRRGRRAP